MRWTKRKFLDCWTMDSCKLGADSCNSICNIKALGEVFEVKRLSSNNTIPKRGSDGAARYDLSSAVAIAILAHGRGVVKTGLAMKVPKGVYATIAPRYLISVKKSIDIGAGVVDEGYGGEVDVVLINNSDQGFPVK